LHLGHARTFWIAQERARRSNGELLLRIDDLDRARCRPEFVEAAIEDLAWFGFAWLLNNFVRRGLFIHASVPGATLRRQSMLRMRATMSRFILELAATAISATRNCADAR
jgi:glutamyl/glutaminyl-tRNA synthetase